MPELEEQEEEKKDPELGCWMNLARICGPDCVAFDDRSWNDPRFNPCIALNVGRSIMVSLAGIDKAFQGNERARKAKELTDRNNIEPPKVNP